MLRKIFKNRKDECPTSKAVVNLDKKLRYVIYQKRKKATQ